MFALLLLSNTGQVLHCWCDPKLTDLNAGLLYCVRRTGLGNSDPLVLLVATEDEEVVMTTVAEMGRSWQATQLASGSPHARLTKSMMMQSLKMIPMSDIGGDPDPKRGDRSNLS